MVRASAAPTLPGSYLTTDVDARLRISMVHEDPFSQYDYSYIVDMAANEPVYFEMPPSYYPSKAIIDQVSADGRMLSSNVTTIHSNQYWNHIRTNPSEDSIFRAIQVGSDQPPASSIPDSAPQVPSQPSGCLIATAAFGSELAPQVQFLRDFRDNHILATASGSSFMNVFNAWYYSFSPQVADYERQQPWLQQAVRVAIYPLLGILQISEKTFMIVPGEFGSLAAGMVASSLIGAVYVSPIAASIKQVRKSRLDYRLALAIVGATLSSVIASLVFVSPQGLIISSTVLVISTIVLTATFIARILNKFFG
jgi:hypothetical protein